MRRYISSYKLFPVVYDEKQVPTIKHLLGVKLVLSVEILSARQLESCLKTLRRMSEQS
jgi:hypothetical protein